jgi:hypothetical protein
LGGRAHGSYRLSGDLIVLDANSTTILITTHNVSPDLDGCSILGPTVCSGIPAPRTAHGYGTGVGADTRKNLTVWE